MVQTGQIIADEARTLHTNGKWADSDTASGNLELIPARWIGANALPNAGLSSLPEAALTKLVDTRTDCLITPTLRSEPPRSVRRL